MAVSGRRHGLLVRVGRNRRRCTSGPNGYFYCLLQQRRGRGVGNEAIPFRPVGV